MENYPSLLEKALKNGEVQAALDTINQSLEQGISPIDVMDKGLIPAMRAIGSMFEQGLLFLPHLMRAAEAMKKGMKVLSPLIEKNVEQQQIPATVIIGTVEGDIHDIGKNIVAMMLAANGFHVIDLGASVSVSRFLAEVKSQNATNGQLIIGLTSLLTTTMVQQKVLLEKLREEQLRSKVKVMVGGACVSQEWAEEIEADGYGLNAQEAVRLALSYAHPTSV